MSGQRIVSVEIRSIWFDTFAIRSAKLIKLPMHSWHKWTLNVFFSYNERYALLKIQHGWQFNYILINLLFLMEFNSKLLWRILSLYQFYKVYLNNLKIALLILLDKCLNNLVFLHFTKLEFIWSFNLNELESDHVNHKLHTCCQW